MEDNIVREVNEAVRQERLHTLWKQLRTPVFVIVGLAIAATAGGSIWKEITREKNAEFTQAMFAAKRLYDGKKYDEATAAFAALATEQSADKKQMALVWQARAERQTNADNAARKTLESALTIKGGTSLWRDLACIELIPLSPEMPPECVASEDSALAPELTAAHAAALWQQGKTAEASTLLDQLIQSQATPPVLKEQAEAWKRSIDVAREEAAAKGEK
jgi:hypothetical protein